MYYNYNNEGGFFGKLSQILVIMVIGVIVTCIYSFVTALVVWPLWNWLMPGLFGLPELGYIQTVALSIVTMLIFRMSLNWNLNGNGKKKE